MQGLETLLFTASQNPLNFSGNLPLETDCVNSLLNNLSDILKPEFRPIFNEFSHYLN